MSVEARRVNQGQYESLVQSIDGIVWEVDAQTFSFVFVSQQAERILGYPVKRWLNEPNFWADHIHADDRQSAVSFCKDAIERKVDHQFDYRMIAADGRVVWLRDIVTVNVLEDNTVRLRGVMVDITERISAECENRKLLHELGERVKELTALHKLSRIIQQEDADTPTVLRELASLLPSAFQYPEVAAARVRISDIESVTRGFTYSPAALRAEFTTADGRTGSIEVVYTQERPPEAEGAFLVEERSLINTLADMLRTAYDRRRAEETLRAREQLFRSLIENSSDAIALLGPDGAITYASPSTPHVIGFTPEEVVRFNAFDLIHPDDHQLVTERMAVVFNHPRVGIHVQARVRHKDGSWHWLEGTFTNLLDEPSVGAIVNNYRDVTKRKQSEERIRQSERQLLEAQRLAHIGSWNWDIQSNTLTWTDQIYRMFGLKPHEFAATHEAFLESIHPEDREFVNGIIEGSLKTHEPFSYYLRIPQADGGERIVYSRGNVVIDGEGNPVRMFGTAQDVTERKRAEEQLKSSNEKLRALSARLQSVREEESLRIAREIHDELGGALTSLRWDLESFDKIISESENGTRLRVLSEKIESMMKLTDTTIIAVRRISSDLRPSVLDDLGLVEAIEWQAQQFQARTGITCYCDLPSENLELSQHQSIAIFRIFQEALTNILRHAQASVVDIKLTQEAEQFVLSIGDNGKGITEEQNSGSQSLGLLGMRERAYLIGGEINIKGVQGKGTVVTVRVPASA
jgi:PAS domain S-box-containing protein